MGGWEWLDFAQHCGYLSQQDRNQLYQAYEAIRGGLVKMMSNPETWCGPAKLREDSSIYDLPAYPDPP